MANGVTMKDIAQVCGVSVNTVSHALHDKPDISAATKERVLKTAEELGYIRNNLASSMRSGRTGTVTMIVSDISNPLFSIMAREVESALSERDCMLFVMNSNGDDATEERAVISAIGKATDGIIICPAQQSTRAIDLLEQHKVPYVLMGRRFEGRKCPGVIWNDRQGGVLATEHLIARGHSRILYVGNAPYISGTADRLAGYKEALQKHGILPDEKLIYQGALSHRALTELLSERLKDEQPFTAVFAFSDYAACKIQDVLYNLAPDKAEAVVGFDDIRRDMVFPLHISSVYTPKKEMAHQVVEMLFEQIEDSAPPREVVLDTTLTVREAPKR